jgi:hypothetical protein
MDAWAERRRREISGKMATLKKVLQSVWNNLRLAPLVIIPPYELPLLRLA